MVPDDDPDPGEPSPEDAAVEPIDALRERIRAGLDRLGPDELEEILDYIDSREDSTPTGRNPVLDVAGILSGDPVTSEELDEELYGEGSG